MALIRWQPFSDIDTLRRQMDHLFDEVTNPILSETAAWKPAVELKDQGDQLVLRVQLPGINAEDVEINATRDAISITGQRHATQETDSEQGVYYSEFRHGPFKRIISLPIPIQNDHVTADFTHGILTLQLPKVDEAINRVVNVKLGNTQAS
ncbi:Hsp20/alpha crystallin family protein [Spirulina major]|uniref:Hsp20/alpha crystallin family protein n=1 Tax=Spirulina major TaxID=270636 RepID=UPI000934F36A|nr:Hsp20/alpha crystallin family protein [Spirulina major]